MLTKVGKGRKRMRWVEGNVESKIQRNRTGREEREYGWRKRNTQ
jgi:hypothetical protein